MFENHPNVYSKTNVSVAMAANVVRGYKHQEEQQTRLLLPGRTDDVA